MSRPVTHTKNSSQHPGQVVLDSKQKRHTSEQKQADDAQAEQQRKDHIAARERGLKRVANVIEQTEQEAENLLTNPPKPRPRITVKPPVDPSTRQDNPEDDSSAHQDLDGLPGDDSEGNQQDEVEDKTPTSTQSQSKRQRMQKTFTRDAVEAARGNSHHETVATDSRDKRQPEKQKQSSPNIQVSAKSDVAGIGEVKDWADKLASMKFLHPSQCSASTNSRHSRVRSISSSAVTSTPFKDPCVTPVSGSARASSPTNDVASRSQEYDSYIQGNDESERQALPNPLSKAVTRRMGAMDVTEVVSDSEPGEWVTPPPLSITSDTKKAGAKGSKGKNGKKRTQQSDKGNEEDSQLGAPPSKRTKSAPRSTSRSHRSGSGVNKKYVKDDLPPGSTADNIWRRLFISALAHFAGGYDDPWTIPSDKFNAVLQQIWNTVYRGKIKHTVTVGGPVYHIAKQNLNIWRSGFAGAAIAVITTLFANDADFTDPAQRAEFAKAMLKKSRFLFSENRGTDNKAWSGLWRAPFVLQTFAHHFNFIQDRVGVADLDKELAGPRTALALSCAAVCRMLTLVSNHNITFKSGNSSNVWTAVIPKGNSYEFNETVWGPSTRRYLDPIKELTNENFALIVEETQKYVKKPSQAHSSMDSDEEDSEYEDLFTFR